MMNSAGNETLDRIQQEIQETLEREEELRKKYQTLNNSKASDKPPVFMNGHVSPTEKPQDVPDFPVANGIHKPPPQQAISRLFIPHPSSKGVMQKFLKTRGKLQAVNIRPRNNPQPAWTIDDYFVPAMVTVEPGKHIRNGFIPAEEKMRRELQEYQKREEELRTERRKSQPDIMAALEKEAVKENNFRSSHSSEMYSSEDLTDSNSAPSSLKRARSLATLWDASDDESDAPGTLSLIRQFEKLNQS